MNEKEKDIILTVKDLRISFKTQYGILQAIRGVSLICKEGKH